MIRKHKLIKRDRGVIPVIIITTERTWVHSDQLTDAIADEAGNIVPQKGDPTLGSKARGREGHPLNSLAESMLFGIANS